MKLFAGVDIGSTTSKCIIIDESGSVLTFQVLYTEFDRNLSGEKVLKAAMDAIGVTEQDIAYIISTGYGRQGVSPRLTTIFQRLLPTASVHT